MRIGVHRPSRPTRTRGPPTLPEDTPWIPLAQRRERKTDPAWRTSSLKLKFVASSTRLLELRSGRRFRIGELVWCAWEGDMGHTFSGSGFNPPFWPAIVLECSLESAVDTTGSSHGLYSVIHRRNYSLLRLGAPSEDMRTQFECFLSEDSILPWQAHRGDLPPWPSLSAASHLSTGQVNPYALALQTGKRLSESWAVCSRFPTRLPAPSASMGEQMDVGASRFHDHQSPVTQGHRASSAHLTDPLSAPNLPETPPHHSPARLKAISPVKHNVSTDQGSVGPESAPTLRSDAAAPAPSQTFRPPRVLRGNMATVTENRYEGLWYGAERIWIGDTVRLCPERDAFASSLRLSHMSRADESWQHRITPSPGAAMRGVLMRIDRIFARVSDTGSKECAIAGNLYEVAPDNWTDTEVLPPNASPSSPHQAYYPWDMPTTPPPRPSENIIVENGDRPMLPPSFPLPSAPLGYTLRPLLPPYSEIALPVHFIAGRYYPDIFQWQGSAPVLPQVPRDISPLGLAAAAETRGVAVLSLCALAPGRFNRAVCVDIRLDSRTRMIEESAHPAKCNCKVDEEGNRLDVDG
jgi:Transcription-silencing protein Clr2